VIRVLDVTGPGVTVGSSILGLVTSGIYDDPLAIYREYIQNAVDELSRMDGVEGKVEITIDPRQKTVSICDNGPGLTYQECLEVLVPIAQSKKSRGYDRGFRGIGRLSGLAFAESVTFLTRANARDPVTRVVWSKPGIADQADSVQSTKPGFQDWVKVETLDDSDYPEHFFRVEIHGISRHSAGVLLNREAVRGYISEVCPVPLVPDFPFFCKVQEIFAPHQPPYSLRVTLDGEEQPIHRQYASKIALAGNKEDYFQELEEVYVPSIDGRGDAAVGWIAHSSYLGAILKGHRIRGIRARAGNIQVGDERVFDHLFEEERFNRWCVGEVHILDSRIVPNGRRDYFERNPHLRNLENHLSPILGQITARCRAASSNRNKSKKLASTIADIEAMYELAASGYLSANDSQAFVEDAIVRLVKVYQDPAFSEVGEEPTERLSDVEEKLRGFHPNGTVFPISGLSASEVDSYRKVFAAVAVGIPSPRSAKEIIDAVSNKSDG
jgi:molecular chaperone HtpG